MRLTAKSYIWPAIIFFCCSYCLSCVNLSNVRPAPQYVQDVADRVAAAAGTNSAPAYVYGNVDDTAYYLVGTYSFWRKLYIHVNFLNALNGTRRTKDILAFMLGHEIAHWTQHRHNSHAAELEADYGGVILADRAGYDTVYAVMFSCAFFRALEKSQGLDTSHPPADERCRVMFSALCILGKTIAAN